LHDFFSLLVIDVVNIDIFIAIMADYAQFLLRYIVVPIICTQSGPACRLFHSLICLTTFSPATAKMWLFSRVGIAGPENSPGEFSLCCFHGLLELESGDLSFYRSPLSLLYWSEISSVRPNQTISSELKCRLTLGDLTIIPEFLEPQILPAYGNASSA
jgi:hypothetical protein